MDTTSLPTGTVTFLFTDIEGSTRLWEQQPEAMRDALVRHDALLRHAIEAHHGCVFKTMGDQFCAAFASPTAALLAAVEAQRGLIAEAWEPIGPLRVRMALHTGAAQEREGDYLGPPLNRVARLLAAAHGGQVLLSRTTEERVLETLPEGASLRDLGAHRLKDLQQPEHLFQLLHPSLPSDFPPLRSLEAFAHNLPAQLTSFIGREQAMAEVKRLLTATRLMTLTGSGGCGKTRLALQVAADLVEEYADGVWLVELAALADPTFLPQTVAAALGVREEPNRPLTQTLLDYLRPRQALLLLDNCEHLLTACAQLADPLLRGCPRLRILATSREGLGIVGEQTYRVPSLSSPELDHLPPLDRLCEFEAVQLFADRASLVQPNFTLTEANAAAVVQVCRRLDGIPLALELAGARVRVLSVEQIAERLDDRFRLLTGGSRTALPRQQTLRALIDWSYDLLSEPERMLLRRLSAFTGGWTLAAAEGVCAGDGIEAWEVLDLLTGLVDKSLVVVDEQDAELRYRLLETVRQYGRDRLVEVGEAEAVRGRHRDWFLALAEEAEPPLQGADAIVWLDRFDRELDNLRAALEWSIEQGEPELELRLVGALVEFWMGRGYWEEGRQWLEGALARSEPLPCDADRVVAKTRAVALWGAARTAWLVGDLAVSRSRLEASVRLCRELRDKHLLADSLCTLYFQTGERSVGEESAALFREVGDQWGLLYLFRFMGNWAVERGEYEEARALYEESLTIARGLGEKEALAYPIAGLGGLAWRQGDYTAARSFLEETVAIRRAFRDVHLAGWIVELGNLVCEQGKFGQAATLFEESLALSRERGQKEAIAGSLAGLGAVMRYQGNYEAARSLCEQGLQLYREFGGDKSGIARSLITLGRVAHAQGDYAKGRSCHEESLALWRELGEKRPLAECLEGLAAVVGAEGHPERAARLFGAAEGLREALGYPLPPADQVDHDRNIAAARTALGELKFAAAWAAGRALSLDEAIGCALTEEVNSPLGG